MNLRSHIAAGVMALCVSLGSLLLPQMALAQTQVADEPLADTGQEMRARALMKEVRCVVCQAQSIDESDAGIASDDSRSGACGRPLAAVEARVVDDDAVPVGPDEIGTLQVRAPSGLVLDIVEQAEPAEGYWDRYMTAAA